METPLDFKVDVYESATASQPCYQLSIRELLNAVRHSGHARERIDHLRKLKASAQEAEYQQGKKLLPAATFAGTFEPTRAKHNLASHSGVCVVDIDHLAADALADARSRIEADATTLFCFLSPGGDGIKVGVCVPQCETATEHETTWHTCASHARAQWRVEADASGKDVSRLCFLSADPHAYTNANAQVLPVDLSAQLPQETEMLNRDDA